MYIYSAGSFHQNIESEELPKLKQEVKDSCGIHVRRIDRFIQLGLIGSHRCSKNFSLQENTGLYLSSGQGPKGNIARALEQIYKDKQPLMPLNFINMVGNSASFYVAKTLNISGANVFITRKEFCLEAALELAYADLDSGVNEKALVGCVDECMTPLQHHRQQLGVNDDIPLGEGSHWLYIGKESDNEKPIAKILHLEKFISIDACEEWLGSKLRRLEKILFAPGSQLSGEHINRLAKRMPINRYTKDEGYYNCISGLGITRFIINEAGNSKHNTLFHLDQGTDGRFSAIVIERL